MWCSAVLCWLLSVAASLAAATSYAVPVAVALTSAAAHGICAAWLRRRTGRAGRVFLVALAAPLLVLTIDNVGRVVHMLGGH